MNALKDFSMNEAINDSNNLSFQDQENVWNAMKNSFKVKTTCNLRFVHARKFENLKCHINIRIWCTFVPPVLSFHRPDI